MRAPANTRARVGSESDMPMRYHDISTSIHTRMPVYEGDPPVEVSLTQSIKRGDSCNVSRLCMGAHTGTHVDAVNHFIDDRGGVDEIPLDTLIGPAKVIDLTGVGAISPETLAGVNLDGVERLLFKTSNSTLWGDEEFHEDAAYLTGDAAKRLVDAGVKLVGIDYLSIDRFGASPAEAHLALLGAGVVILEGLDLSRVEAGDYRLICLPLPIRGCDGSPCRAVLEMPEV